MPLGIILVVLLVLGAFAATSAQQSSPQPDTWFKRLEERTATLQRQVSRLAEEMVSLLGDKPLEARDVRAITEVLALQRAVEVFANLVANHNVSGQQDVIVQSVLMVEEYLQRAEKSLEDAPNVRKKEAPEPPASAHPVSIRSTLQELRRSLGIVEEPVVSQTEPAEPKSDVAYLGPEPTNDEYQAVRFNLQRLRAASEQMGHGKCYREFWTRNCADALEYHALPHQKRSFVKLLVTTRDLIRKYCASPKVSPLRREYTGLIRHLAVRPIVYDYGANTTPFVDQPDLFRLQCPSAD